MRAILHLPGDPPAPLLWSDYPDPEPAAGEVVLQVAAAGVNRADLLQVQGHYPPPKDASPLLGLEVSGRVIAVGENVTGWCVGDTAMALLAGGGYAERVAVDARHLMPVPPGISLVDAAALPEAYLTAWLNLIVLGRLQPGERVLIQGGSGGVGTAALQLCRDLGAEVWTTAGGPDRCARCLELGAEVALDHRDEGGSVGRQPGGVSIAHDFATRLAAEGGADVILDVMGARALDRNLHALAPGGRLVVIGLQGGRKAELDLGLILTRRLTVMGSTLRGRSANDKAALIARFTDEVWPAFGQGRLSPVIDRILPLAEAERAHRALAAGEIFGKLLLWVDA